MPQTAESESWGPSPHVTTSILCLYVNLYINLNTGVFRIHILIRSLFFF